MTLDERLTALTMNLELAEINIDKLGERLYKQTENLDKLTENVVRVMGIVEKLATLVMAHEHRIEGLEGGR